LHLEATVENKVVLRTLSEAEVQNEYVLLRFAVLHGELGWTSSKLVRAEGLLDVYDSHCLSCGVFHRGDLVGAFRVVVGESVESLPSGKTIKRFGITSGNCAELSRGMVREDYRRCGVFTTLIAASVYLASTAKIDRVFATVLDSRLGRELFRKYGFQPVGEPFHHSDGTISISKPTILLSADLHNETFNERESLGHINSLLESAAIRIGSRDKTAD